MAQGVWSDVFNWPVIGIQATLLPDGRVLSFGTDQNGQQGAMHIIDVWDPVTNTHTTLEHGIHTDLFCSAAIIVPETGEVLIAGGDTRPFAAASNGVIDVNTFDYRTNTLSTSSTGDMTFGRWYPTALTLANGKTLVLGGRDGSGAGVATPEIYTPGVGWKTLDNAAPAALGTGWFYPTTWVASDGRIVTLSTTGPAASSTLLAMDASGDGRVLGSYAVPFKKRPDQPAIMFDKDKALVLASDNSVWIVDFSAAQPKFTKTTAANGGHYWSNMTLLADGSVLMTGGSSTVNKLEGVNYTAAIWHPETGKWTYDDDAAVARLYHSSTILLADGTVLSLGGGAPGPLTNLNGEIYKPGYLFNADGTLADRPEILVAPKELEQRQDFTVQVDDPSSITKLKLVKYGTSTHGFNPESRMIDLKFTVGADGKLHVDLPDNANLITPGYWMLFAFNGQGTPSIASTIHIATGGELLLPHLGTFATLNGAAAYDAITKTFTLTADKANDSGEVISNSAIDLTKNFAINAQIKFGAKDVGMGGISFVLHNDPVKGDAVGFGTAVGGAYGISNGLAIEFDVSNDGAKFGDIAADHTGFIDTDAALTKSQVSTPRALGNLEDGKWHTVQIVWNAATHTLQYKIDGVVAGTLNKDIAATYFGGADHAYFGFTGATGAIGNVQQVKIDAVTATYVKVPVPLPDEHPTVPHPFSIDELAHCVTLSGGARFNDSTGVTTLTPNAPGKIAGMMSEVRVDLTKDATFDFDVFLGTKDGGGDGLAFVLHNDPVADRALGTGGNALGAEGIRYGLAVEFDTWNQGATYGDIPGDHTQFVDTDAATLGTRNVTGAVNLGNIEDGVWHAVRVTWDADTKTLSYSFDGKTMATLTKDLAASYLAGSNLAYFGFTGATGGASNLQQVRLNDVNATFAELCDGHEHASPMRTVGSAGYNRAGGAIQLTPDKALQTGGVMSEHRLDLTHDFEIRFDINLGSRAAGGDGIAFVLHNDPRGATALGNGGASFGAAGIANGLAIEFDTWNQGATFGDIANDHTNFFDTDATLATRNLSAAFDLGNKEDGLWHAVKVNWDAETHKLWYSVDGRFAGVLAHDIGADYFGHSSFAHFGVTGATGGAFNLQQVRFVAVDGIFE